MDPRLDLKKVRKYIIQICAVVVFTSLALFAGVRGIVSNYTTTVKQTINIVVKDAMQDVITVLYDYMDNSITTTIDKQFEKLDEGSTPRIADLRQIVVYDKVTLEKIGRMTKDLELKIDKLTIIYNSSL